MKIPLGHVAHARSGDKGDASNVGLIADSPALYEAIRREVTAERVKRHFAAICRGEVGRFEVPNLLALNFLLVDHADAVLDAALVRPVQEEPAVRKTTERVLPVAQHDTAQPNQGIRQ